MNSRILSKLQHRIFKNSFYLYLSHFADYLLLIIVLPFIARALGPIALGNIGLAQTFGLLVLLLLEFGFNVIVTREVALNPKNNLKILELAGKVFSFKIYLIPLVIFITLIIILIHPVFYHEPELLLLSVLAAIFQSFIPTWYFQGVENFKHLAITKTIFRFLAFITALLIVKSPSDGWLFLMVQAISSFLIAIFLLLIMSKKIGMIKFQKLSQIRKIVKSSFSGFVIIVLPTVFNNIIIFLLSYILNPLLLGYYYGVTKIHRAFNTLYSPIFESFFPYLISIYKKDQRSAINKIKHFNFILLMLGCFFAILIWFLSETIITVFLGEEFIHSANYLRAFGLLLPVTVISYIWGNQWMIVIYKEEKLSKILLISNLVGITLFLIIVSKFEIFSVPISIAFSEVVKFILIINALKTSKRNFEANIKN